MQEGFHGALPDKAKTTLTRVQSNGKHLLGLINSVLDISKIEAGELQVSSEPFDLRASIDKIAGIVKPLAENKGLALRVELAPAIGEAVSDARRIEQILLNLLNNAIKFTQRGEVALTADVVDATVRMRIADTGMGIKPEDLATLFLPFQQIDTGLSRNHEGTGLGLAICRKLAYLLGGNIQVESEWGQGSIFTILLPLRGGTPS
ncbi:MAG: sensor histidine kinase, partial [Opitutaceae bacterium]